MNTDLPVIDLVAAPGNRIIRFSILFLLLLSCNLLMAEEEADTTESPGDMYRLVRVERMPGVVNFWVVDLDGDGIDDIFRIYDGQRVYHANKFVRNGILGPALYQGNSLHHICEAAPIDIDTIPGSEIALIKRDDEGDSLWIEIHKGAEKELLCQTKAVIGRDISEMIDNWDGGASHCYAMDLDDDGSKEIILPLTVAYDLYPRGVYVYDYPSGDLRWWYPLAGSPMPLRIADANKDGFKEIYIKTFASFNGAVVGDLADTISYIHAVDHLGYRIWKHEMGDVFDLQTREPHICDCDGDGEIEIYSTMIMDSEEHDQRVWALQKRRASDNFFIDQVQFGADQGYSCIYSADLGNNDTLNLLLDNNICLVDPVSLMVLKCAEIENGTIREIADIYDDDPRPEILVSVRDSIYIVNADLNIRGRYGRETEGYFTELDYFETPYGDHYILATAVIPGEKPASAMEIYNVEIVPEVQPAPPGEIIIALLVGLIMGLILGGITVYFYMWNRQPTKRPKPAKTVQYNNLLTTLTNFEHGRMAGKNLNRLLFLFSNLPESQEKLGEIKPNIKSTIEAYQSFTQTQLQNIVNHAGKLLAIKATISQLARDTQKLREILNEIKVMELAVADAQKLRGSVPKAVQRIKHGIGEIKGHVQRHFSTGLLRVIPDVLSAAAGQFQQLGIGFTEITTRGGATSMVFFDEAELAAIFEEFLSNACDAMAEARKKEMSLDIRFENGEVIIKLSDTGHGLKVEDGDQVFNRDYSTRGAGRGYGLFNARQQIERFGGQIRLYNNNDGPGSTVEITLKTVADEQ
jgi:signal transduction histidine kinase